MTTISEVREALGEAWDAFQNAPCDNMNPGMAIAFEKLHGAVKLLTRVVAEHERRLEEIRPTLQ